MTTTYKKVVGEKVVVEINKDATGKIQSTKNYTEVDLVTLNTAKDAQEAKIEAIEVEMAKA